MSLGTQKRTHVPTHIITGFLGVGKTSAILHLLKNKPHHERWAVLVNEFGEIGVDGSLFEGTYTEEQNIFIREVPGGCMCCSAGIPMHAALTMLLTHAQPDRLLIEPTGLGHPLEVIQVLSNQHYQELLSIQKIITLVDARQLSNAYYTEHATFNQQIALADLIIGNKRDLYSKEDEDRLKTYIQKQGSPGVQIHMTEQGVLDPSWLEGSTSTHVEPSRRHLKDVKTPSAPVPLPKCGYVQAINQGEGFQSVGWRWTPYHVFDHLKLRVVLQGLSVERMKGVFITQDGIFGYNLTSDGWTERQLNECLENRIEIIAKQLDTTWKKSLFDCIIES